MLGASVGFCRPPWLEPALAARPAAPGPGRPRHLPPLSAWRPPGLPPGSSPRPFRRSLGGLLGGLGGRGGGGDLVLDVRQGRVGESSSAAGPASAPGCQSSGPPGAWARPLAASAALRRRWPELWTGPPWPRRPRLPARRRHAVCGGDLLLGVCQGLVGGLLLFLGFGQLLRGGAGLNRRLLLVLLCPGQGGLGRVGRSAQGDRLGGGLLGFVVELVGRVGGGLRHGPQPPWPPSRPHRRLAAVAARRPWRRPVPCPGGAWPWSRRSGP